MTLGARRTGYRPEEDEIEGGERGEGRRADFSLTTGELGGTQCNRAMVQNHLWQNRRYPRKLAFFYTVLPTSPPNYASTKKNKTGNMCVAG